MSASRSTTLPAAKAALALNLANTVSSVAAVANSFNTPDVDVVPD